MINTESVVNYDAYDLLIVETHDALGNRTRAINDYRMLAPRLTTDPNGNRAEIVFDTLGMVVGAAAMGKATETFGDGLDASFNPDPSQAQVDAFVSAPRIFSANPDESVPTSIVYDLLGNATTRIVYDLDRFIRLGEPPFAATIARETHVGDLQPGQQTKIQISFSYSDGFGREIQKKVQAEPGPVPQRDADGKIVVGPDGQPVMTPNSVSPRWVGTGWTVFNNKGKPVRQYEPFFTDTHQFEFDPRIGVSPVLFYDPVERVVATLHTNHTWEKIVFDPWSQETWDVNDTVLVGDPKADAEVGDFFYRLPDEEYLPTWYGQRAGGGLGPLEQDAATKAAAHAGTPSVAHSDSLGRTFLTIADNAAAGKYSTRVELDIEGNQRAVIDAKDRIGMRYDYDMLGTRVHQASMEAGERWMLNDSTGKPIRAWDSRDHQFRTDYDPLRRPTESFLQEGTATEIQIGHSVYGESRPNPESKNQRGKVVQVFDQAGVITTDDYDFKGNLLQIQRQLARNYKATLDWSADPILETEKFTGSTTYDALNRPMTAVSPDGSVYRPTFNEASLLEKVDVNVRGATVATSFVTNINYNAKGQRVLIEYGNGTKTTYVYDPLTFRLANLTTLRGSERLQDLSYMYDPIGNITHIQDGAQQTLYFNNQVVTPDNDYEYDAIYRLITAEGREHIGQVSQPETTWDDEFRVKLQHPQNGQAMRRYTERYEYDPVGNFERMIHQATNGNWTRRYTYNETSQLEPPKQNNRLSSTIVGGASGDLPPELYLYDTHGNMLATAHLPQMDWGFKDELRHVNLNGGGESFYVYDAGGQRMRKVVEKNGGTLIEERIYLGGFEIFRKRNGTGTITLERETLHIMDDKQRIALVETRTQGIDGSPEQLIRYQFSNHLGSASLELDDVAQIISYEEYYPYGSTSYQAVRNRIGTSPKRYRYSGMERDEESGLNYHGARYYVSWLGRWMSGDPIGIRGSLNLFAYCHNNPVRFVDTNGKEPSEHNSQPSGRVSFQAGVQFDIVTEGDKTEFHEYSTEAGVYWTPTGSNVPALRLNQDKSAWEPIDTDVSIYEYQQTKAGFGQRLANRITGGVGLIFSGFEAYAGGVIIAGSEGWATVSGWALVVDASDKGAANARQLLTGEVEHSLLYKGVKKVTGSDTAAFIVDNATPIVIAGIAAARPSTTKGLSPISTPAKALPAAADEAAEMLRKLGASEEDLAAFARGEKVWIFGEQGGIKTTSYYQFEGGKLTAGVLSIKNIGSIPSLATVRTIKSFFDQSMSLAKQLNAKILRLEGNTVTNLGEEGMEGFLHRQGFIEDPVDPGKLIRETQVKH